MGTKKHENTLDDVVLVASEKYGLIVTPDNKTRFSSFVRYQHEAHPEFDINLRIGRKKTFIYLNAIVDRLLLYSIIMGDTLVQADYLLETHACTHLGIGSVMDLFLFQYSAVMIYGTDQRLKTLFIRIRNRHSKLGHPSFDKHIDELGKSQEVFCYLTRSEKLNRLFEQAAGIKAGYPITYQMVLRCPSLNPASRGYGGDRTSERFRQNKI